jgi:hypothetical protein
MSNDYRRLSDDEIERLIRGAPRRRPSPALWERVAAEASCRASRRPPRWTTAAGAAGAAALAVGLSLLILSRPTPPRVADRPTGAQSPVAAPSRATAQSPSRVTNAASAVARPRTGEHRRATHRVGTRRPEVLPTREDAAPREPPAAEPETVATLPVATPEDTTGPSFYIEVSREGGSSVLEGSVVQNDPGGPREIRIVYNATRPQTQRTN